MSRVSPKNKGLKTEPVAAPAAEPDAGGVETVILKFLLIVLAGLFVYAPAFHGDWLWDDDQEITANAVLPDPNGLIRIWKGETGADYFPLKASVQWIYYRAFGTDRTAWHLLNVVLHLVNALLVWKVLAKLRVPQAWLGGLIFSIHPILVESVAWVSELKNTLSLPFLLLAMMAWIDFDRRGLARDYVLALILFILSILCKTSVVMFPVVLLLYSWWRSLHRNGEEGGSFLDPVARLLPSFIPAPIRRGLVGSVPFFLVSLGMGLLTIEFQHHRAIGSETIPVGGMLSRTATAGVSILFYFYKTILPFGLLPIYPRWKVDPPPAWMFLAWPLIAGVLVGLWTKRRTWGSHVLLGLGFFLINLFPIIGFIKMSYMRITWVADHFLYLPALGLIGLAAAGLGVVYNRVARQNRALFAVLGAVGFGVLAVSAHNYAGVFANEYAMWTYTLKSNPEAWQAHSRLGKVMIERGDNDRAFYHIQQSVQLRPDLAETHNNYGAMLEKKGDINGAVVELRTAVKLAPDIGIYRINLGSLLVRTGRYQEGREVYRELLVQDPENPTFLCNLGVAEYFLGNNEAAIACFEKALAIRPDLKDARENLLQARRKRDAEAGSSAPAVAPAAPGLLGDDGEIRLFGN